MTASVHRRTPSLTVSDSRGLPIRQIAYLRTVVGETATALVSRQQYDAAGRLVAQWDPRLTRPNLATVYGLGGAPLKVDSVDAGWRLSLPGLAGQTLQRWDARGSHWRTTYDDQLRMVAVEENAQPDVETFTYADTAAGAGHNLRGQLLEQVDPSGTLRLNSYGLLRQPLRETRTFDDAKAFVSRRTYSPLGAVLEQTDAGEHRQQSCYDLAGQLKQVQLKINGQTDWQPVLEGAQYNAAGKIIEQQAGNGVISRWSYDPADGRLQRQHAQKDQQPTLQDFEYVYDPVGNITHILDHVFSPSHFANQRVDGHREFSYDSLYRLHSASGYDDGPPADIPGLPQPTDPQDRRNYTQTYQYDHGDNLIKLSHVREGASHTRQMFIDPVSNRGVRWTEGDPDPQFDTLFDRHGNLQALQPGQGLRWNVRDQLASVTLVHRDNGPNDEEQYRYSQGARVYKRHETHTATTRHFHEVRYLPGLEIRTRDNGEVLHVIILGNARCLHRFAGKPLDIDAHQLRYNLDDHLGSCLMELDQQARLISHEGYYPFGATAWMTAHSSLEVSYKTVRYSGKEMDVSGLYYYGARYYAPWLQRWVSADPAGDVDGLNLYGFVGNNPLSYVDPDGSQKEKREIVDYSKFITVLGGYAATTLDQMLNVAHQQNIGKELLKNLVGESINAGIGFVGGYYGSQNFDFLLPDDLHVANFTLQSKPMYSQGVVGGNIGGDIAGGTIAPFTPAASLIRPLIPQTSAMTIQAIDQEAGISTSDDSTDWVQESVGFFLNRVVGSVVPAVSVALNMGSRVQEAEDIKNRLDPVKIQKIETMLESWKQTIEERSAGVEMAYGRLKQETVNPIDLIPNVTHMTDRSNYQPIRRSTLHQQGKAVLGMIESTQTIVSWYKEDGTTDNQYLKKQARESNRANQRR
ncbi:RHS repeat-associated core domain-containing protein [Pseudomonas lini]|uniref:RHS repeat domain-containing protein n=1 Tax=Pseudomonas lini TaxID=163011 RepID=UPI0005793B99|nr:RHS repeat-associated core domain-containing protein [Pseudomonas lini]NSX11315.1 RHS repeat-associated core domain-containing protein [Pseudomonas lini]